MRPGTTIGSALFLAGWLASLAGAAAGAEKIALKVFYAGNPGTDRAQAYVSLLGEHFASVESGDYRTFKSADAGGRDVVILDWAPLYKPNDKGELEYAGGPMSAPEIGDDYDRATLVIGGMGQRAIALRQTKINWHCLCLLGAAHGMALEHEIFQRPLVVAPTFETAPTPRDYTTAHPETTLPPSIKVWKVLTKTYPDADPGLVASGLGFDDSPDAEFISSGLNAKGPDECAIGRHGNFFLWGFSASPDDMTESARRCFINSVCYIHKFDRRKPLFRLGVHPLQRAELLSSAHFAPTAMNKDAFAQLFPPEYRDKEPAKVEEARVSTLKWTVVNFPASLQAAAERDPAAYARWVKENYEWLYKVGDLDYEWTAEIDEDVKSLGPSNHRIELLDACVAMLEKNDRAEVAQRVLRRYTAERFADSQGWRTWLDAHRARLYFTETGGYKFLAAPPGYDAPPRPPREGLDPALSPSAWQPAVAEAHCEPARLHPGDETTIVVRVAVADGWHIAGGKHPGPEAATRLTLELPEGVEALGEWTLPEPTPDAQGKPTFAGSLEFRRRVRVGERFPVGPLAGAAAFAYQACDLRSCRPPTETRLRVHAEVVAR